MELKTLDNFEFVYVPQIYKNINIYLFVVTFLNQKVFKMV